VKQDANSKLSYARDSDRFAVVLFFNQRLTSQAIEKTSRWVRRVIDHLIAEKGSFYLPYQHFATPEQFKACYPHWRAVLEKKQTEDPQLIFENGLCGEYIANLLGTAEAVKGYVEIEYNGRLVRSLKKHFSIMKPVYVLNEKESFKDVFERGRRPYDTFIPLNNYSPIREELIPTESVDLVACYIGLHHIPHEQLDPFLASIRRVLRRGGSFILMDHDASTHDMQELVHVVHSIFNAATGVAVESVDEAMRIFESRGAEVLYLQDY
jgi:SAM-dependent methyltransferase